MPRGFLALALVLLCLSAPRAGAELVPGPGGRAPAARLPVIEIVAAPVLRPRARPPWLVGRVRCTADGVHCIALDTYVRDVCTLIETAAGDAGIDPGYFARLLWKESLFDASAVSPAGAQGIAQFMPGTAALRGLEDPFNPALAIFASATYLSDLADRFGNPGLAAVAYNGGEARAGRFLDGSDTFLPAETRDYVAAITGYPAEDWRDAPPEGVDYRLDADTPFATACVTQAADRAITEFRDPAPPWGVIIAAGRRRATAEAFGREAARDHAGVIDGAAVRIVEAGMPGFGRGRQYTAQIPAGSRQEALDLCRRLRAVGAFCLVNRN